MLIIRQKEEPKKEELYRLLKTYHIEGSNSDCNVEYYIDEYEPYLSAEYMFKIETQMGLPHDILIQMFYETKERFQRIGFDSFISVLNKINKDLISRTNKKLEWKVSILYES